MNRRRPAHPWRSLTAGATPRRVRRWNCLLGAGVINAVLFLTLVRGLPPGGDGVPADDALAVVILRAQAVVPARPMKPEHQDIERPQRPAMILGDVLDLAPTGPPTETPESVQQRLAESKRRGDAERSRALECNAVPSNIVDRLRPVAVLSVRVGVDGRALDAEIDRSSGRSNIDKMLVQCARTWGPFPIAIVDGRIVESWQSIAWPASTIENADSRDQAIE